MSNPNSPETEQLKKLEALFGRVLQQARPGNWLQKAAYGLVPNQVRYNHLVVELLVNLFESYRSLLHESSDAKRELAAFQDKTAGACRKLEERIAQLEATQWTAGSAQRAEVSMLRSRVDRLAAGLVALPVGAEPCAFPAEPETSTVLDAFYFELENRFRGSKDEIRERLRQWLPQVLPQLTRDGGEILDLGCGRGEWLELLQSEGYAPRGIDSNPCMVAHCRELGLAAEQREALVYLRALPDGALQLVTGFHLIEHFTFTFLRQILAEVLRALRPGGIAVFETPNPTNVTVGSHTFYRDPTHKRPLPPLSTAFLFESLGFEHVRVIPLNPAEETYRLPPGDSVADRFNAFFYGPQDYGIVARKPAAGG